MNRPDTISIILIFSLLASAGNPVLATPQTGKIERENHPHSRSAGNQVATLSDLAVNKTTPHSPYTPDEPLDPELRRALIEAEAGADEYVRVIVYLHEQADLDAAVDKGQPVTDTRARVVSTLQTHAEHTQAPLRTYLEEAQAAGLVDSYTPFWIFNGIAVRARPSFIRSLLTHPTVATVQIDHWRQWITDIPQKLPIGSARLTAGSSPQISNSVEWGIARIRADQVWASLQISGTGAVVAGLDTGVDWLHPALQTSYRGYNPHGPSIHTYSWYDATGGGALYPVDGYGHGSHTMGTMVGQDGIGVAPGAQWIAVKMLNNQGAGFDSWIHAAFQWILAPGGDPSKAPDVINGSWGSSNGAKIVLQPDLQALRAAGIFPVFASGNTGPSSGTVSSPASLPEVLAVGAIDSDDEVGNFSSRGPSPWGDIRPHVAAPGVDVRSCAPGGTFDVGYGTSMAAPHVTGIVALLRAVSPTLSITHTAYLITSTAVPLTDSVPNNDTGWGRVDAFAAVAALAQPGFIAGTVRRAGPNTPLPGASVVATPHAGAGGGQAATGDDGSYLLALAPNAYDLTVSAFGYEAEQLQGVVATAGTSTVAHFFLTPLPSGDLQTHVTDATTGAPVVANITVLDTPLEASASAHTFALPGGAYTVQARVLGYRVVTASVHITAGQTTVADLALPPAPSILLLDSGSWYHKSQINYFRQALDDLGYVYDEWSIKYLPGKVPEASDLMPYDLIVWSAPLDAPAYIGAESALIDYLSAGGRLLLSGQDVGYLDDDGYPRIYYEDYLKANYVNDIAPTRVLDGVGDDIFAGMTITITGPGGADNQDYPDEIEVADPDAAAPLLTYREGECGGLRAGTCLDYRVIYLSFGFEAINERAARREVMGRALDWLVSPPQDVGIELQPASQTRIDVPWTLVTHTLRARHVGQGGITDTITLTLDGADWETQLGTTSLSLSPCASATVVITVTIPPCACWDAQDTITVTARSALSPTLVQTSVLTTKTPAPILLVDDGRWYHLEDRYETALASSGLAHDYWRTGWYGREPPWGSPTLEMLERYPLVVWYTGYDWYKPVTDDEAAMLTTYLDGGGRLFLSSQDLLYFHHDTPFSQDYLGVLAYTEDVTPTLVFGVPDHPIGEHLGPYSLDEVFRNWSDGVVPAPGVSVALRTHDYVSIALARQAQGYKTVFFAFPFEMLPDAGRGEVIERVIGWLSWLGDSTFAADRETVSGGDTLTYTAALRNDGLEMISASLSNTLPLSLTLVPGSLTGLAVYSPTTRHITWERLIGPGTALTVTYRVTVAAGIASGTRITNTARLGVEDQGIRFHRDAVVSVSAPDLSPSTLWCDPPSPQSVSVTTCTLALANVGLGDAGQATAFNLLPWGVQLVPGSPSWTGGGTLQVPTGTLEWRGPLNVGGQVTLTYQITLPAELLYPPLYSVAYLEDGEGGAWRRATWLLVYPLRFYLPMLFKNSSY